MLESERRTRLDFGHRSNAINCENTIFFNKEVTIPESRGIVYGNHKKSMNMAQIKRSNMTCNSNTGIFEIIDGRCVIPEGVTMIPDHEFRSIHELREVVIPSTVVRIGVSAFESTGLISVRIPSGVLAIMDCAFSDCFGLKEVELPESLLVIGNFAFSDCPLRSLKLPEGLVSIGDGAFACGEIASVTIPANLVSIGIGAFSHCNNVKRITVDENNPMYRSVADTCLTKDGKSVVFGCENSVIPEGVRFISDEAFCGIDGCTDIRIPDGVLFIGSKAFFNALSKREPVIPDSVTRIAKDAFCLVNGEKEGGRGDDLPF